MPILYKIVFIIALDCIMGCARERAVRNEKYYQDRWCAKQGGKTEVTLADRSRCDCLTAEYAIEFDFAGKWEAMEQALNYARLTGKKAGIVFICRKTGDIKKIRRTKENIRFYKLPIRVWRINC